MSEIKFKYINSINKSSVLLLVMGSNNPSKVSSLLDQDNKDLLKKSMKLENYRAKYPELAKELERSLRGELPENWDKD